MAGGGEGLNPLAPPGGRVVKLVRAMRKGWLKRDDAKPEKPAAYLLWEDDGVCVVFFLGGGLGLLWAPQRRASQQSAPSPCCPPPPPAGRTSDKTATGLTYIPAPKPKLPGHAESYNPPREYLPTVGGRQAATAAAAPLPLPRARRPWRSGACARVRVPRVLILCTRSPPTRNVKQDEEKAAAAGRAEEEGAPQPFVPTAFDSLRKASGAARCGRGGQPAAGAAAGAAGWQLRPACTGHRN